MGLRPVAMKVHIAITDDQGRIFEGQVELSSTSKNRKARKRKNEEAPASRSGSQALDLTLPLRPFLKKSARGKSGAAKLTLLVAHMSGGKTGTPVDSQDVQAVWNRVTAFLGDYNRAHATRAKDKGWVDSPKHGQYVLRPSWEEAAE